VAAVVDATVFDPGCAKRRRPVAVAELLQVDVAATCSGEQEWRIEVRRKATERVDDASAKRHPTPLP
jgi:hypothetical protein